MDKITALKSLGLPEDAKRLDIDIAYGQKKSLYEKRIEQANTEALKNDFELLVNRLNIAYEFLRPGVLNSVSEDAQNKPNDDDASINESSAIEQTKDTSSFTDNELDDYLQSHQKQSLRKSLTGLILFTFITLICIGLFSGFLQDLWNKYRPLTSEEIAAKRESEDLAKLISGYKLHLDKKGIALIEEVEASDKPSEELRHKILSEIQVLAETYVFKSVVRLDYEREEREVQDKYDSRDFSNAIDDQLKIKQGYLELHQTLHRLEKAIFEKYAAYAERDRWSAIETEYSPHGLKRPDQVDMAEESLAKGEEAIEIPDFEPAFENFSDAKDGFISAQQSVADEIAAIKRRLTKARSKKARPYSSITVDRLKWLRSITPPLVRIPSGTYTMGSKPSETSDEDEMPAHKVKISAFKLSKYEISKKYFQFFVDTTGYKTEAERNDDELGCAVYGADGSWQWREGYHWQNPGYNQDQNHPAVCISWNDADAYVKWLSKEWGARTFRLVSESEWEYAARAGSQAEFFTGKTIKGLNLANCDGCGSEWDVKGTAPIDSFKLNKFRVHAMYGNAFEWTRDCWHDNYDGAPKSNSAWLSNGECDKRVLRGGSWFSKPKYLRAAYRSNQKKAYRSNNLGFRITDNKVSNPD